MTTKFVTKFSKLADPTLIRHTGIPRRIRISQRRRAR